MSSYLNPSQLLSLVETHFGKAGDSARDSSREGSTWTMSDMVRYKGSVLLKRPKSGPVYYRL